MRNTNKMSTPYRPKLESLKNVSPLSPLSDLHNGSGPKFLSGQGLSPAHHSLKPVGGCIMQLPRQQNWGRTLRGKREYIKILYAIAEQIRADEYRTIPNNRIPKLNLVVSTQSNPCCNHFDYYYWSNKNGVFVILEPSSRKKL